ARNSRSGAPSNTEPMSSRSSLMFLRVNGTAQPYDNQSASTRVVEGRRVAAVAGELEAQRAVVDVQLLGDELLAALLVPRDHARHALAARGRVADAHAHVVADAQPLAPRLVGQLDLGGPHAELRAL